MSEGSPQRKKTDLRAHLCFKHVIIRLSHYPLSVGDIQNSTAICCVLVGGRAKEPIQGTFPQIRDIYFSEFTTNQRVVCSKEKERNTRRDETRREWTIKSVTVNKQMSSHTGRNRA